MTSPQGALERHLLDSRERIVAFVRARLGDADAADDVVQEASLRALRAAPELRDESRLPAWFHTILLNTITDMHRRGRRSERLHAAVSRESADAGPSPDEVEELCRCFEPLLQTLKPEYAEVLAADLRNEDARATAERLHITPNNLKVRRHRAREVLRARLDEACRMCGRHGCLDCTCGSL
ncbi:MAG TPA: sigma-70 family RNA polymerase sigma factor [Gemmatimonadales bacterium]|nr:sigma-70 family RNA polymerase sigma factor [Gemmatimonadales bacterium]